MAEILPIGINYFANNFYNVFVSFLYMVSTNGLKYLKQSINCIVKEILTAENYFLLINEL